MYFCNFSKILIQTINLIIQSPFHHLHSYLRHSLIITLVAVALLIAVILKLLPKARLVHSKVFPILFIENQVNHYADVVTLNCFVITLIEEVDQ